MQYSFIRELAEQLIAVLTLTLGGSGGVGQASRRPSGTPSQIYTTVTDQICGPVCSQYLYILHINIHKGRCAIDSPVVVHSVDGEVLPRRMTFVKVCWNK
ncbi:hypothetical protein ROHU_007284 [Labeo rohita]|uniref:Uncharacterized protein n=1 Tax=Labeo rohita TaxID=84645 RepID=A0A498MR04_LABRO|nr:hypothetical protein ROHU_007284 [Labeo rohita]